MAELNGKHIIRALQKKWILTIILSNILWALGISILLSTFLYKIIGLSPWWVILFFIVIFLSLFISYHAWKIKEGDVSQFLNQTYPQVEESCDLILKPYESLNLLEKLQVRKTGAALSNIPKPALLKKKFTSAILLFSFAIILCLILINIPYHFTQNASTAHPGSQNNPAALPAAKMLPQISLVSIKIKPPIYTAKEVREQDKFNVEAEEGSMIDWQIKTTLPVSSMQFIFNDTMSLSLHPTDDSHTLWVAAKSVTSPGFYQVKIGNELSELYKIEMIKDQPPLVHIQTPKQYTTIDFGEPQKVEASVDVSDDYGIHDAYIIATIANGSGEAVKFKEQKINFPGFNPGYRKYQLQKNLQLNELGMQPGDELYFYVSAIDNHNQETRSDVYIVTIQDTAQLMSMNELTFGINIKPEYFRSERQIIIETEQLIKDKNTITEEAFKNKSNDLGIDQKLLRLRYGKFLGEEAESNIPGSAQDPNNELSDPKNFGNAEKVLDQFTDKHDNSEDASFFEPEVKKQLKATLNEMWNAELQLRTFKPVDALPYEYKALRLLKDLQQKSRAYVAKTSFKSATLKPEKRLTGDLSKIAELITQQDFTLITAPADAMRDALGILEQLKTGENPQPVSIKVLDQASLQLSNKASAEPAVYLTSFQAFRKILAALHDNKNVAASDIALAENGFHRMMTTPAQLPGAEKNNAGLHLSQQYFMNLTRSNQQQ
jgi:hypothetical protein